MTKPTVSTFNAIAPLMVQQYERYLPSAFDESMSILQKMNKIIQYLNEIGATTNDAFKRWNEVMEWVLNDGLNESVTNKLDSLVADGTLGQIINQEVLGSRSRIEVSTTEPLSPDDRTFWYQETGSPSINAPTNPQGDWIFEEIE